VEQLRHAAPSPDASPYASVRPANEVEAYRAALGRYLDLPPENVTLFWKGRIALYAILEALGIGEGAEILLPAFTCVVVPNAILYRGARPVYLEIEPATLHVDLSRLSERATGRTRVLLAQNTFGLAPPMEELREFAKARGLVLVEDCAHGFGGTYRGEKNGTLADVSFFSTQWNKPYSTGLGGIAVTRDPGIAAELRRIESRAEHPTARETATLAALLRVRKLFSRPELFTVAANAYRALGRRGVVVGSAEAEETAGATMPGRFLKRLTAIQAAAGLRELARLDSYTEHRRLIADIYDAALGRLGIVRPLEPAGLRHTYLKYPIFVRERDRFLSMAAGRGIAVSDWFRSPIHPIPAEWEKWDYSAGSNPIAEQRSASIVNLPTQPGVTPRYARRVVRFVDEHRDWVRSD
jgi:perosamine synthetase